MKTVSDRGEKTTLMEPLLIGHSSQHRPELTDLVRAMNCYYSNLIEGHKTHPVDIERAMRENYSKETRKRDLQLEARAHVTVRRWIDRDGLTGKAATRAGICEIHKRFCELLPDDLLWAIARGLAGQENTYKAQLQACDLPRRNDLDGCGSRSEEALVEFTRFFLQTCLDQVSFMENLVEPNRLRDRIRLRAEEERRADALLPQAGKVLDAVVYRGELPRGDVPEIVGTGERQARSISGSGPQHLTNGFVHGDFLS